MKAITVNKAAAAQSGCILLTQRPWLVACAFGLAAILWRIPFIFRYDLNFQTEYGVCYLMAKRILLGEFPIYFWESDYMGTLPQFLVSGFFAVFGSSIELSVLVSVLSYAAAVALGVWFVRKYFGLWPAVGAGVFAALGVPYTLHYCAEPAGGGYVLGPLIGVAFVGVGAHVHQRGWSLWCALGVGLLVGHGWYYNKQCLIGIVTVLAVLLADERGRQLLKELVTTRWLSVFLAGLVVGYLPEIIYRLSHAATSHVRFGVASFAEMQQNLYWLVRVIPAYFDGEPLSRLPEGVHYLQHDPHKESLPVSPADWIGIAIAFTTVVLMVRRLWRSWKEHNAPVLLLGVYPLLNFVAVVVSKQAVGEYYAPKRYLFTSAVILLLWAGIECAGFARRKNWWLTGLLALLLPLSAWHHIALLRMPDELHDYREVVRQLEQRGLHNGVTFYTYAFSLIALSDEKLAFSCLDYNDHEVYRRRIEKSDTLALVHSSQMTAPPQYAKFLNHVFRRDSDPHVVGELSWTVYRKTSSPFGTPAPP